jgi:hypothetical protein
MSLSYLPAMGNAGEYEVIKKRLATVLLGTLDMLASQAGSGGIGPVV